MTLAFLDTNVVLYLLDGDAAKADRAEVIVRAGGVVSTQVLNEFASVAARKLGLTARDIRAVTQAVRSTCRVVAIDERVHDLAVDLFERHLLSFYDAAIVAAAMLAGADRLLSEDFSTGMRFGDLVVENPFRDGDALTPAD